MSTVGKIIPGFAPAVVRENNDPEGLGRVRVELPGLMTLTPYWVMPAERRKGDGEGSQYPPPDVGEPVCVTFMYGEWMAPDSVAFYFGSFHGVLASGASAGPTIPASAASADSARKHAVLWESAGLVAYVYSDPDNDDEKLVLKAKTSGSKIEINARDGASGKAESIYIEARTLLSLYSVGLLDIRSDTAVQIQGRRVADLTKRDL